MNKTGKERCRYCGAPILLLKTTKGKTLPCNPERTVFVPELFAETRYVMADGEMYRGVEPADGDPDVHEGYSCHFDTCPKLQKGR